MISRVVRERPEAEIMNSKQMCLKKYAKMDEKKIVEAKLGKYIEVFKRETNQTARKMKQKDIIIRKNVKRKKEQ